MKRILFSITMLLGAMCASAQAIDREAMARDAAVVSELGAQVGALNGKLREIWRQAREGKPDTLAVPIMAQMDSLNKVMAEAMRQFAADYPQTDEGAKMMLRYVSGMRKDFDMESAEHLLALYQPMADNKDVQQTAVVVQGMKHREVGAPVANLTMLTPDDKEVNLTDFVGHGSYVLVDFWASWCGPCCQEMPNVKAAYERYHEKGFDIVGVSFDQKKEAWVAAIERMEMSWPQMSDLKGWQCAASDAYNVHAIPFTILFAPDGTVYATGLRGEQLEECLQKIFD